jgi:beta-N-acetylhexosaminidase
VLAVTAVAAGTVQRAGAGAAPGIERMVGQLMLVRMQGKTPSAAFLARVRRGELGGVVLFADNFGAGGPARLVAQLQAAAKAGGQPRLLIAVDQEGGIVKRVPGAPTLSPPEMGSAAIAEAQGEATAANLARAGVDLDLAPVLDVGRGGFITPRTFGATPAAVAARGPAFAAGLARGHVLATAKHFPGLGYASLNTDKTVARVTASARQLQADWLPFRAAIRNGIPLVMMSTAVYPALGSTFPAALSPNIVADLRGLGFKGVVVTDALQTPAVNSVATTANAAVQAVEAGDDLVLAAGSTGDEADTDGASIPAYHALVAAARSGKLRVRTVAAAYALVLALKQTL